MDFIERQQANTANPFFGYFAFREVHGPYEVAARYQDAFLHSDCCGGVSNCALPMTSCQNGVNATLCGMITAMDDVVGDLIAALDRTLQLEHTVVIC